MAKKFLKKFSRYAVTCILAVILLCGADISGYGAGAASVSCFSDVADFKNVVIRNVTTCSQRAISIGETCRDVLIENVTTYGPNQVGVRFYSNFECDNLTLRNLTFRGQKGYQDSVFWMSQNPDRQLKNFKVENVLVATAPKYMFRETEFPVEGLTVDAQPTEGWFAEGKANLGSAYGRYHYMAYGKVLDDSRPADNRYAGTLKTPAQLAAE